MTSVASVFQFLLWAAFVVFFILSLLYLPSQRLSSPFLIGLVFAALVVICLVAVRWLPWARVARVGTSVNGWPCLPILLAGGVMLRLGFVALVPPVQLSDLQSYVDAAVRLEREGRYYFPGNGFELLAWRPPGLPLLLAAAFRVVGEQPWLPLFINVSCFLATGLAAYSLAARLSGDRRAGLFATALLACWPGAIAGAGLAATEPVSLALLTVSVWAFVRAQAGSILSALLAGLCTGYGILVRPGLLLFPVVWLMFVVLSREGRRRGAITAAVTLLVAVGTVAPWTIRNYRVLNAFVPVSTNGGSVFYRANNPKATGGFTDAGERDVDALQANEVVWNHTGMAWGIEWIRQHPHDFARLAVKKQAILTGSDDHWVYWAVARGLGYTGPWYGVARMVANGWWVGLLVLTVVAGVRGREALVGDPAGGLLITSVLYLVAVHSVFESQSRYHDPIVGVLATIAALAIWQPSRPARGTGWPWPTPLERCIDESLPAEYHLRPSAK